MKIVFCGNIVPESFDTKLKYLSPAGNRFQINMCRELEAQGHQVRILSYLGFPMEIGVEELYGECDFFPGAVKYIQKKKLLKSIVEYHRELRSMLNDADVVMSYNVIYAWFFLPLIAKQKKVKSVLVWADYTDVNSYTNTVKKIYAQLQLMCAKKYSHVVGLSNNTKRFLKNTTQKFICIEGGISKSFFNMFSTYNEGDSVPTFMYSGLLEPVTGIDLLLEAFCSTDIEAKLMISGKGSLEEKVQQYSQTDNRISYLGYMDYEEYINKLKEATVLVNPRNMNLLENQNNFPSKIMEYLATGKPILSTKFIGYEKFEKNIYFVESNTKGLFDGIISICSKYKDGLEVVYEINRNKAKEYLWDNQIGNMMKWVEEVNGVK